MHWLRFLWMFAGLALVAGCPTATPVDHDDDGADDDDDSTAPEPERDPAAPFALVELFTSEG